MLEKLSTEIVSIENSLNRIYLLPVERPLACCEVRQRNFDFDRNVFYLPEGFRCYSETRPAECLQQNCTDSVYFSNI